MQINITVCDFCQTKGKYAYSLTIHYKKIDICSTCADLLGKTIQEIKHRGGTTFGSVISPKINLTKNIIDCLEELNKRKDYICKECKDTKSTMVSDYENSLDHIIKK